MAGTGQYLSISVSSLIIIFIINILKLKPNVELSKHSFSLILSLPKIRLASGIGSHFIKLLLFGGGLALF